MGDAGVADAAAVASNFERMVRIADSIGIELGGWMESFTEDVRADLSLDRLRTRPDDPMTSNPAPPPDLPFTIGIEEEYLVVDRESRDLIQEAPPEMIDECRARLGEQVTTELMQCQIEVGTAVSKTMQEARADLARLRRNVSEAVRGHGFEIIAASTHPFARGARDPPHPQGTLRHPRGAASGGRAAPPHQRHARARGAGR